MTSIRAVILGDELLTAAGDPKGIGWLGRVQARLPAASDISMFPLPMIGETSSDLLDRFKSEALPRFSDQSENKLILCLGSSDIAAGLTISRSRLNLATVLDDAIREGISVFVIGPTPTGVPEFDAEVSHLSDGFADVVKRRQLTYVDCFSPLVEHEGWLKELTESSRRLPGQVGYGLIAWF
ncbi:MAG: lysophospholipase, partial [Aquiluna sp.]|nr:lysophospholipase [Aquiluna sp.]